MIIICKEVTSNLPPLVIPLENNSAVSWDNFVSSTEWFTIDATISGYSLTKGKHYQVYGIFVFDNHTRYVLFDDNNVPGFFPAELFCIDSKDVLFDWKVAQYNIDGKIAFYIGYPELAESYDNLVDLVRCSNVAIKNLLEYKAYISNI